MYEEGKIITIDNRADPPSSDVVEDIPRRANPESVSERKGSGHSHEQLYTHSSSSSSAGEEKEDSEIESEGEGEGREKEKKAPSLPNQIVVSHYLQRGKIGPIMSLICAEKLPAHLLINKEQQSYLLHFMAYHNKGEGIQSLLAKYEPYVNVLDINLQTPLHIAAQQGNMAAMLALLEHPDCTLDSKDKLGSTPLTNACKSFAVIPFIYLYFAKSCDVLTLDVNGCSLMHWAAYNNNTQLLKLFTRHLVGLDVNKRDKLGMTPIFRAAFNGSLNSLNYLLENGTDLSIKNQNNQTVTDFCRSYGRGDDIILKRLDEEHREREIKQYGVGGYLSRGQYKFKDKCRIYLHHIDKHYKSTLGRTILIAALFWQLWTLWLLNASESSNGLGILEVVAIGSIFITLLLLISLIVKKNPGYLPKLKLEDPSNVITDILERVRNMEYRQGRMCLSCLQRHYKGDEHCSKCDRCVSGFQLHSKWLGVCLGQQNVSIYFFWMLSSVLLHGVLFPLALMFGPTYPQNNQSSISRMCESLYSVFLGNPLLLVLYTFCQLFAFYLFIWLLLILSSFLNCLTINESLHIWKYTENFHIVMNRAQNEKVYAHNRISWKQGGRYLSRTLFPCRGRGGGGIGRDPRREIDINQYSHIQMQDLSTTHSE